MAKKRWTEADIASQQGKTIIITGANSGLGLQVSTVLSRKGANVVMAVRNFEKGQQAARTIRQKFPNAKQELMHLDLADFNSIHRFTEEFHSNAIQSSFVHKLERYKSDIHFDDLKWEKSFNSCQAYAQSKLANFLFAYELDRRFKANAINTIATAAHPGYTKTNLQKTSGFVVYVIMNNILAQRVEVGTLPILRAATGERLVGSEFFGQ